MAKQGPAGVPAPNNELFGGGEALASQIHPSKATSASLGGAGAVGSGPLVRGAAPAGHGLLLAPAPAYSAMPVGITYAVPPGRAQGGYIMGQAVQYAAEDPQVQHAVRGALRDATHTMVKEVARRGLQQLVEVQTYVQENPSFLRALCFCVAAALLIISGLSLLKLWNIIAEPFEYLFALYDALFAAVIVIIEGKPEWFQCHSLQSQLFSRAAFLASQTGRAAFYIYVGTVNLYKLPQNWLWKLAYVGMGGSLCAVGLLMLFDRCYCKATQRDAVPSSSSSEDGGSD